jgi:hypothetical protein
MVSTSVTNAGQPNGAKPPPAGLRVDFFGPPELPEAFADAIIAQHPDAEALVPSGGVVFLEPEPFEEGERTAIASLIRQERDFSGLDIPVGIFSYPRYKLALIPGEVGGYPCNLYLLKPRAGRWVRLERKNVLGGPRMTP